MAVRSVPSSPFSSIGWQPNVLMVGNHEVSRRLSDLVHQFGSSLKIEADPNVGEAVDDITFGRDHRVVRLDGSYLFPYPIQMEKSFLLVQFKALLPESSKHTVLDSKESGFGTGFYLEYFQDAVIDAQSNEIPHWFGKCTLEGGNCHLFKSGEIPKAIVGIHSVIFSLIGLSEQRYFIEPEVKEKLKKYCEEIGLPSEESLRIARNLLKYVKPIKGHPYGPRLPNWMIDSLIKRFVTPLTEPEKQNPAYEAMAIVLQAKIMIVKELIAEELGVQLKNVAFIPQFRFHIDMETCVDPSGKIVYIQDEEQASACCNEEVYKEAAEERFIIFKKYTKTISEEIERIGCTVAMVPGAYEAPEENPINFLNGVFVPGKDSTTFITNGTSQMPELQNHFAVAMKKYNPELNICFTEGTLMETILSKNEGGVHCLTWYKGQSTKPA